MTARLTLFLSLLICAACGNSVQPIEITGQTMGTTYRVVVSEPPANMDRAKLLAAVEETLVAVNADYSNWDPNSEVSLFNASSSLEFVEISQGFQEMLDVSDQAYHATGGRFDLTLTPIIELWGFGPSGAITQQPDEETLQAAREKVGQDRVIERTPDGTSLRKALPEATIYLTAVAKGYGIDAVANALDEAGATDFMVEIGGDLYVSGQSTKAADWMIGIERPGAGLRDVEEIVGLTNVGMATSGDYRNYFEEDGVRYSHIIDGQTGKPITHHTASVTVIAESALVADAWATALLAVGIEDGLQIALENDVEALFITRDVSGSGDGFELVATPGFESYGQSVEK